MHNKSGFNSRIKHLGRGIGAGNKELGQDMLKWDVWGGLDGAYKYTFTIMYLTHESIPGFDA